jgi:hypothetical protein
MKDGCFEARLTDVFEYMYDVYWANNKVYFEDCTLLHDVYRNEDEYLSSGFKLSFLAVVCICYEKLGGMFASQSNIQEAKF